MGSNSAEEPFLLSIQWRIRIDKYQILRCAALVVLRKYHRYAR
jgi:hypothetical protein